MTVDTHSKPRIWRGFFMGKKKPPQPKLKRPIFTTGLLVVEVVLQQFEHVMYTQTNHHEVPRTFKFQHARPSRSWARPPARLSRNTRAFGNTPRVSCEVAKLVASRFHPARRPTAVWGGPAFTFSPGQQHQTTNAKQSVCYPFFHHAMGKIRKKSFCTRYSQRAQQPGPARLRRKSGAKCARGGGGINCG